MTAAVNQTGAAPVASAFGRASRGSETSEGGFGDALDRAGSGSGRHADLGETQPKSHRWRQHGEGTGMEVGEREEASAPESMPTPQTGLADGADEDEIASTTGVREEAGTQDGEEIESGAGEDAGRSDSVSIHLKAHHAISAMMAVAPAKSPASRDRAASPVGSDEVFQLRRGKPTDVKSLEAKSSRTGESAEATGKADTRTAAPDGTAAARKAGGAPDPLDMPGMAGNRIPTDAPGSTRAQDPGSGQATSAGTASIALRATSSQAGSGQPDADARERRGPAHRMQPAESQAGPAKVSVISQQVVPAPTSAPALGANTAAIVAALDAHQGIRPSDTLPTFVGTQPMRSLKIQLHPVELGVVTANLKGSGDRLSVELQVENHEAHRRLSADSDTIVKSLRALGYDIDRVTVMQPQAASAGPARSDINAGSGSFQRDASSFQSGNPGSGGDQMGSQSSSRGDRGDAQHGGEARTVPRDRAGGSLYI